MAAQHEHGPLPSAAMETAINHGANPAAAPAPAAAAAAAAAAATATATATFRYRGFGPGLLLGVAGMLAVVRLGRPGVSVDDSALVTGGGAGLSDPTGRRTEPRYDSSKPGGARLAAIQTSQRGPSQGGAASSLPQGPVPAALVAASADDSSTTDSSTRTPRVCAVTAARCGADDDDSSNRSSLRRDRRSTAMGMGMRRARRARRRGGQHGAGGGYLEPSVPRGECSGAGRRFEIVLLSSFPRSGNSWSRLLIHGATEYMDRGIATNREMTATALLRAEFFSACPPDECSDADVAAFIRDELKVVPDPGSRRDAVAIRNVYGINGPANVTPPGPAAPGVPSSEHGCQRHFQFRQRRPDWRQLLPPVLVKSHFPFAGDDADPGSDTINDEERFVRYAVSRVVRIIRNPFDNLASRFLGNHRKFKTRWDALAQARADDPQATTDVFEAFLKRELAGYLHFFEYWARRRETDAARGIPTFVTRYESLCANPGQVVDAMVRFGGWNVSEATFRCTLAEVPCLADPDAMPQHLGIYTAEQIERVWATTAPVLRPLGYAFDTVTGKLRLTIPTIPMCL